MKQIFLLPVILMLLFSCNAPKQLATNQEAPTLEESGNDMEYDVEMFNEQFESWYLIQDSPSTYRTQAYYENWNKQYVAAWNIKCASPQDGWDFDRVVGYNPSEDYGFELNHKLFYYFQYVEHVLDIPILVNGPKVVLKEP